MFRYRVAAYNKETGVPTIMNRIFLFLPLVFAIASFLSTPTALGASLFISPSSGTFTVQDTFKASLFLDTEGEAVNAFEIFLAFPADKLQLVSPSIGNSIANVWVEQPVFDNYRGVVELRGGMPGGTTTPRGVIADFVFRIKAVGEAM